MRFVDGFTGTLVPFGDEAALAGAVITLLRDQNTRKVMADNADLGWRRDSASRWWPPAMPTSWNPCFRPRSGLSRGGSYLDPMTRLPHTASGGAKSAPAADASSALRAPGTVGQGSAPLQLAAIPSPILAQLPVTPANNMAPTPHSAEISVHRRMVACRPAGSSRLRTSGVPVEMKKNASP